MVLGVPAQEIIKRNQDYHLHTYMASNGLSSKEAALESFMASKPPRDYFLNTDNVQNIQRAVHARQYRRHPNQQQSVDLWVKEHAADVLLHQRQEPLPGTPDYAHLQKLQAAAAAGKPAAASAGSPADLTATAADQMAAELVAAAVAAEEAAEAAAAAAAATAADQAAVAAAETDEAAAGADEAASGEAQPAATATSGSVGHNHVTGAAHMLDSSGQEAGAAGHTGVPGMPPIPLPSGDPSAQPDSELVASSNPGRSKRYIAS